MRTIRQHSILLVEDNPDDVELTIRAFRRNNIAEALLVFSDGIEALEYLHCTGKYADRDISVQPVVVLLDLKLPKMDGIEVLHHIRNHKATGCLPVVILTSSREQIDVDRGYGLGANSYIVKPVDFQKFTEAVGQLGIYWLLLNERSNPAAKGPLKQQQD